MKVRLEPGPCGLEDARVSATELVDGLLGVPHQEDPRGHRLRPILPHMGLQPCAQQGPLGRAGVLKLIDEDLLGSTVPARKHGQALRRANEVEHSSLNAVKVSLIGADRDRLVGQQQAL